MAARDTKLYAFAHLQGRWAPCGQLTLTEEGERLLASSFVYGSRYLERRHPLEVDPVALSLKDPSTLKGRALLPALGLPFFGGIRDAAPDAWGRRVIEAKLRVPANSLPESQYLLHAGSDRVRPPQGLRTRRGRRALARQVPRSYQPDEPADPRGGNPPVGRARPGSKCPQSVRRRWAHAR